MKRCKECGKNLVKSKFIFIVKDGLLCEDCHGASGNDDWKSGIPVNSDRGRELLSQEVKGMKKESYDWAAFIQRLSILLVLLLILARL